MTDRAWRPQSVSVYWDRVADRYLELYRDELGGKPFDRRALDAFASGWDEEAALATSDAALAGT